jgi:hypothetical protein
LTTPTQESPVSRRRRQPTRIARGLIGALVLVAAALAGWYLLRRPRLTFTNELAAPIWLSVGQAAPMTIGPGATHTAGLPGSGSVVVQWNLARPLSANDRPMGEEVRGSLVLRDPSGTIRQRASVRDGTTAFFAPLISNGTEGLLRVRVNAGLEGVVDCGCAVRPGAQRVFVGYYRLYQNSTVQARDESGRTATFRDLGPKVTARDGAVGLRFESKDFR